MEEPTTDVDVVIIGAGAAGMMCAIETGKRGRRTIILEHNDSRAKKSVFQEAAAVTSRILMLPPPTTSAKTLIL